MIYKAHWSILLLRPEKNIEAKSKQMEKGVPTLSSAWTAPVFAI